MLKTCLIIPCYNEETRLNTAVFEKFLQTNSDCEFLFVNDGSDDETQRILERLCQNTSRFEVLNLEKNLGKAEAVRHGITHAQNKSAYNFIGYWDADLSTSLEELPRFLETLSQKQDIHLIMGSRVKLLGRHIERKAWRHYLGRCFATCASLVLDLPVYDTQCGAKIFRTSPLMEKVFEKPFLSRWIFDVEIIARMLELGLISKEKQSVQGIYEIPIRSWKDIGGSKLRMWDFFKAIWELLRIRLGKTQL